jgi:cytochrome c-type biogenesis protein
MHLEPLLTSLSLGFLSAASPCLLPLYPGFLAYLSGQQAAQQAANGQPMQRWLRYLLGVCVLAGVLTMMLLLGFLIALLSISIGQALGVIIPLADGLIIALGVLLLLNRNPFKRLPQIQAPLIAHPLANAYVYGLLYGPLALPCSGPLVVGIFALSLNAGEAVNQLLVFLTFGLGFGLPLLALSLLAGATQRWITRQFAQHARLLNMVSGVILLAVAFYDLASNWDMLRGFLGLG